VVSSEALQARLQFMIATPDFLDLFSVVMVLDERSSKHFLFFLARHFLPRYDVTMFRRMLDCHITVCRGMTCYSLHEKKPDFEKILFCIAVRLGHRRTSGKSSFRLRDPMLSGSSRS
jgi:hypothetical protein